MIRRPPELKRAQAEAEAVCGARALPAPRARLSTVRSPQTTGAEMLPVAEKELFDAWAFGSSAVSTGPRKQGRVVQTSGLVRGSVLGWR